VTGVGAGISAAAAEASLLQRDNEAHGLPVSSKRHCVSTRRISVRSKEKNNTNSDDTTENDQRNEDSNATGINYNDEDIYEDDTDGMSQDDAKDGEDDVFPRVSLMEQMFQK
jgi:hypothetical protein